MPHSGTEGIQGLGRQHTASHHVLDHRSSAPAGSIFEPLVRPGKGLKPRGGEKSRTTPEELWQTPSAGCTQRLATGWGHPQCSREPLKTTQASHSISELNPGSPWTCHSLASPLLGSFPSSLRAQALLWARPCPSGTAVLVPGWYAATRQGCCVHSQPATKLPRGDVWTLGQQTRCAGGQGGGPGGQVEARGEIASITTD